MKVVADSYLPQQVIFIQIKCTYSDVQNLSKKYCEGHVDGEDMRKVL
jgi:hypothetical protein